MNWSDVIGALASGKGLREALLENLTAKPLDPGGWDRLEESTVNGFWIPGAVTPLAMRIRKPLTLRRFSNWLAGLGIGNHIQASQKDVRISEIAAITLHIHTKDGQAKSLDIVLDERWRDPYR